MENFEIKDKVVFKKEVLDIINKAKHEDECVKSLVGYPLTKEYYDYLMRNSDFRKLGYFEVKGLGHNKDNIDVGLYLGKDLFEHYKGNCSYKKDDALTIGDYEGTIDYDSIGYFLNFGTIKHNEVCNKLKELFGKEVFTSIARKCNTINFESAFFPDFESIENLVNFVKELNKLLDSKKESNLTTTKNYQNNEIKFQRAKASSKRGDIPAGSTISGRKDKIAISIGHLSYQVCNC